MKDFMRAVASTTLQKSSSKDFLEFEEILRNHCYVRQPMR